MAFTTVTPWIVGQRLRQIILNKQVTAIQELQDEVTTGRPQLRVYAPASVTLNAVVPYASVRTDTHGGWDTTNKTYTIPKSGMYQFSIGYKSGAAGTTNGCSQYLNDYVNVATKYMSGPNGDTGAYQGGFMGGCLYFALGSVVCVREQGSTYTPQNDPTTSPGTGSNYFHCVYLGPV